MVCVLPRAVGCYCSLCSDSSVRLVDTLECAYTIAQTWGRTARPVQLQTCPGWLCSARNTCGHLPSDPTVVVLEAIWKASALRRIVTSNVTSL